jgi:DNA gyrase/topoisomerase IV subunit A
MIKKSLVSELPGPSSQTFVLVRVNEGDRLISVGLTDNKSKDILLVTAQGMAIRFKEDDVRPMGLVAAGVNGMKLDEKDEVVGMEILPAPGGEIFIITSDGKAKRIEQKDFPAQGRYGKGIIAWDLADKVRLAGVVVDKPHHMATIHLTKGAPKSTRLDEAGLRKRAATKGDAVVEVKPGEEVVSVNVGWIVERFVMMFPNGERKNGKTSSSKVQKEEKSKKVVAKKAIPKKKPMAKAKAPAKKKVAKAKPTKKTPSKTKKKK